MFSEFVEVLVLMVRGTLFAGLCWGAWLCLGEQTAQRRPANSPPPNHQPLGRFATFAVLLLVLTALADLVQAA